MSVQMFAAARSQLFGTAITAARGGGADVFHNLQLRLQTTRAESEPQREKPTKNSIVTMKIMEPASTTVEKDQKKRL